MVTSAYVDVHSFSPRLERNLFCWSRCTTRNIVEHVAYPEFISNYFDIGEIHNVRADPYYVKDKGSGFHGSEQESGGHIEP